MYAIAICDDNEKICHHIEDILIDYAGQEGLSLDTEVFYDGESLLEFICSEHAFDLIYLDIEMKKLSGLDLSRRLRESMNDLYTEIAFVTGTSCYDRLLFDVQPLSFIPKPVERIKVIDTLRLAMKRQNESAKVFTFKTGREHVCVPLSEILYMESRNRIITVVTLSETYTYYGRLHKAEEHLPSCFCRIHRSYIANLRHIRQLTTDYIILTGNIRLSVSENYRQELKERYKHFILENTL